MRLEEIVLKNFGSFADATINLEKVSAGVVVGENGAGKSTAFIDAVLWALFGKCRVATDAMIRLGATDMAVSVTFSLSGHRYRVTRQRSIKTKAGKSGLEVQMQGADGWEPITGSKLDDTQAKLESLLRLDYDLLTSTGFLVQGQADQFVRVKPTERKAILSSILQLDRWGEWRGLATSAANREDGKLGLLRSQVLALRDQAGAIETIRLSESTTADKLDKVQQDLAQAGDRRAALLGQQAGLKARLDGLTAQREQEAKGKAELARILEQQTSLKAKQDRYDAILADGPDILGAEAELVDLRSREADLAASITHLDQEIQKIDVDLASLQNAQRERMAAEKSKADKQREMERIVDAYMAETDKLSGELDRMRESTKLLSVVPCGDDLQKRCQFTVRAVAAQGSLPEKEAALKARKRQPGEIVELVSPGFLAALEAIEQKLAGVRPVSADDLSLLSKNRSSKVSAKSDAQAARSVLQSKIRTLEQTAKRLPELEQAERELPQIDAELARLQSLEQTVKAELEQVRHLMGQADGWKMDLQMANEALLALAKAEDRDREQERTLTKQLGQLQEQRAAAERAKAELSTIEATIHEVTRSERHYRLLSEAYAEIPVLVMESSIPILEQRANEILAMISTSGLVLRIETQKAMKSRDGLAETLEIIVRDRAGERPYEAYSGGERMRIDLALRIALSDLLAQRAGAKLHTLVIDEAFAPLDVNGVEQMRQCLEAIQKIYPLILVITHDQRMKDTFGTPIVVSKTSTGSRIEVLG